MKVPNPTCLRFYIITSTNEGQSSGRIGVFSKHVQGLEELPFSQRWGQKVNSLRQVCHCRTDHLAWSVIKSEVALCGEEGLAVTAFSGLTAGFAI